MPLESGSFWSLAAALGPPNGALQLLAGCNDGALRVLGTNGAGGALQLQAVLAGHAGLIHELSVMLPSGVMD